MFGILNFVAYGILVLALVVGIGSVINDQKGVDIMILIHIFQDGTMIAESATASIDYTRYIKGWENLTLKEIVEDIKETEEMD